MVTSIEFMIGHISHRGNLESVPCTYISTEGMSISEHALHNNDNDIGCVPSTKISLKGMSIREHAPHIGYIRSLSSMDISIKGTIMFEHVLHRGNIGIVSSLKTQVIIQYSLL